MFRHRRTAHGEQRGGRQTRQKELARQQVPIQSLMDLECGVEMLLTTKTVQHEPAVDAFGVGAGGNGGRRPGTPGISDDPGDAADRRSGTDDGPKALVEEENADIRLAAVGTTPVEQWTNYAIEVAYIWMVMVDGHRIEEALRVLCPALPEQVRHAVILAVAFCRHPRLTEEEIIRGADPSTGANMEERRQYVDANLLPGPPAAPGNLREFRETEV